MFNLIVQFCYDTQTDRFLLVGFNNDKNSSPQKKGAVYFYFRLYSFDKSSKIVKSSAASTVNSVVIISTFMPPSALNESSEPVCLSTDISKV